MCSGHPGFETVKTRASEGLNHFYDRPFPSGFEPHYESEAKCKALM